MDDEGREVGNRFQPTEEQIILIYLDGKMQGRDFPNVIHEIDICKFEPWELSERAALQSNDRVWYFFSKPDYKYAKSTRINRRTTAGYWKPTGKDRIIRDGYGTQIGVKKNLVFHLGSFGQGTKTNWVLHEYHSNNASSSQKPFALCRLKKKSGDDDGPSHQMASQGEAHDEQVELESLPDESELDYEFLSDMLHTAAGAQQGSNIGDESELDYEFLSDTLHPAAGAQQGSNYEHNA